MSSRDKLISECKDLVAQWRGEEDIVLFLRQHGCSKLESIAILKSALDVDLGQAKKIVHFSEAWKDRRLEDEKFHKDLETALKNELE
jgi:hypothetical protein